MEQENQDLRSDNEALWSEVETLKETVRLLLSVTTPETDLTPTTMTTTESPTPMTTTAPQTSTAELEVYEGSLSTDDGSFSEAICEQFKTGEHRNVGRITGDVHIESQSWLSDMSCFLNIVVIGGYLYIRQNAALTNVDGLSR